MKDISLSIFFPAYNEEANIEEAVRQAIDAAKDITNKYEVIVVNDGSKDKTGEIIDRLAAADPEHIRAIHHKPNQGYGAAVWSGMRAAKYDYVFFTDSDLQFDLKEIKKLVAHVPEYEVVLGYRAKRRDPFVRLLNAKSWNVLNRLLFGLKVKDIDCAFKLFKREIIQDLPVKSKGAMLSAEFLIRLQRSGVKFKEVPVTHLPRTQGSPTGAKPAVIMRAFKELFMTYRGDLGSVTHRQLVKFAAVGAFNTAIDLLIYFTLTRTVGYFTDHLLTAKVISYLIGSIGSFLMNRFWTFRRTETIKFAELAKFYTTVLLALVINVISLFIFLRLFNSQDVPAVILSTLVTFAWNFIVSKFWVFSNKQPTEPRINVPLVDWAILLFVIAATAIGSLLWLQIDNYPPHWDMANHLRHSLEYTDTLEAILNSGSLKEMVKSSYTFLIGKETYYPPFAYQVSAPFVHFFGRTFAAAVMSNTFFLVVLVLSIYAIGKKLWNRTTGLLAVFVMLSFPFIATQFHEFQLDMPLAVMATLAFWGLLQTNKFQNYGWSFIFGVFCGLGMLTKWPLAAFVVGPLLYVLVGRIREIQKGDAVERAIAYRELLFSIFLAGLGLLITAGPWYLTHLSSLKSNLAINWETGTGEGDPSPLSPASLRLYSDVLIQAQIRLLMLVPFVIGLITTIVRKENRQKNGLLLAWLIGGYIVMTIYNNKDYRFIEPVLGSIAVISVYWISQLVKPWRYLAVSYIVLVAVFQFLSVSWGQAIFPNLPPKVVTYVPDIQEGQFRMTVWEFTGYGSGPPKRDDWHQKDVIAKILETKDTERVRVAMYYKDQAFFNRENIQYFVAQQHAPIEIVPQSPATFNCTDVNYIIATDKDGVSDMVQAEFPYYEAYSLTLKERRHDQPLCSLEEIYRTTLPNDQGVFVWKVKP